LPGLQTLFSVLLYGAGARMIRCLGPRRRTGRHHPVGTTCWGCIIVRTVTVGPLRVDLLDQSCAFLPQFRTDCAIASVGGRHRHQDLQGVAVTTAR
jgi:hypothetical protein